MLSYISLFILVILFGAALRWLVLAKKKKILMPIPDTWKKILLNKVHFYRNLSKPERARFEDEVQKFLNEIIITGVETKVSDEDKVLVAASGVIPIFGFPGWHYPNLQEVLLYPGPFNREFESQVGEDRNTIGLVGNRELNGTMILSKPALHLGFEIGNTEQNVGIHEFVHLLDKADGSTDGIPELFLKKPYIIPWIKIIHSEILKIKNDKSDINFYGTRNEAEFLSVVSEYFFQNAQKLHKMHPDLYAILEKIYHQDLDEIKKSELNE